MDTQLNLKKEEPSSPYFAPTYFSNEPLPPMYLNNNRLPPELLIQALEQIHLSLQAGLDIELKKYNILMEMKASSNVKIEKQDY